MTVTRTLVLNAERRAINIIPVFDAVKKVFNGRALFLDPTSFCTFDFDSWIVNWDDAIRTSKIAETQVIPLNDWYLLIPEVIVCTEYRGFGQKINLHHRPSFSRRNIWLRDKGICQFCGFKGKTEEMNMGHIIPKSRGGKMTWENIVLSCISCNNKMANHLPSEVGMKLIRKPIQPTAKDLRVSPLERVRMQVTSKSPRTWEAFLGKIYWGTELVE